MSIQDDPPAPEEIQAKAEKAFTQSEGHVFNSQVLQPFTPDRQIAAENMGLKYGYVPEEDMHMIEVEIPKGKGKNKRFEKVKIAAGYRGFLNDVIIVLWLCSVRGSEVFRAQRKVDEALKASQKWAADQKIGIGTPQFIEASQVFMAIMDDIRNSRAVPESKDNDGDGEEEEAPGE